MTELRTPAGSTIQHLARQECIAMLSAHTQPTGAIARVAWVRDGRAMIRPVTVIAGEDAAFFRTSPYSSLRQCEESLTTLEFDDLEPALHAGWSVLATGIAHACDDDCGHDPAIWALQPWADGSRPHVIAVSYTEVTGIRLVPRAAHVG